MELEPTDDRTPLLRRPHATRASGIANSEKQVYLAAIAKRPHCWAPRWWLATWQFRAGQYDEAMRSYEAMIQRAPQLSTGYASLGGVLILRGEYARAIETLRRSVALRPTKTAFDNLGTAYFNTGTIRRGGGRLQPVVPVRGSRLHFVVQPRRSLLLAARAQGSGRSALIARPCGSGAPRSRRARRRDARSTSRFRPPSRPCTPSSGRRTARRRALRARLAADSTNSYVAYCAALTYWQLNEREPAMRWLERAVAEGYPVTWLRDSPIFHEWRDVAAFQHARRAEARRDPAGHVRHRRTAMKTMREVTPGCRHRGGSGDPRRTRDAGHDIGRRRALGRLELEASSQSSSKAWARSPIGG